MKTIVLALLAMGITMTGFAQTDTTGLPKDTTAKQTGTADTIKVGGMIIQTMPLLKHRLLLPASMKIIWT